MSSTRPWEEVSSTGGLQGQKGPRLHPSLLWVLREFWGASDLSAQRGVNFSVAVSFILFQFSLSWKVGVGSLVLWRFVMVWDWWVAVARQLGWRCQARVCIHRRGRKEGPSQLVCAMFDGNTRSLAQKTTHDIMMSHYSSSKISVASIHTNAVVCECKYFTAKLLDC